MSLRWCGSNVLSTAHSRPGCASACQLRSSASRAHLICLIRCLETRHRGLHVPPWDPKGAATGWPLQTAASPAAWRFAPLSHQRCRRRSRGGVLPGLDLVSPSGGRMLSHSRDRSARAQAGIDPSAPRRRARRCSQASAASRRVGPHEAMDHHGLEWQPHEQLTGKRPHPSSRG